MILEASAEEESYHLIVFLVDRLTSPRYVPVSTPTAHAEQKFSADAPALHIKLQTALFATLHVQLVYMDPPVLLLCCPARHHCCLSGLVHIPGRQRE